MFAGAAVSSRGGKLRDFAPPALVAFSLAGAEPPSHLHVPLFRPFHPRFARKGQILSPAEMEEDLFASLAVQIQRDEIPRGHFSFVHWDASRDQLALRLADAFPAATIFSVGADADDADWFVDTAMKRSLNNTWRLLHGISNETAADWRESPELARYQLVRPHVTRAGNDWSSLRPRLAETPSRRRDVGEGVYSRGDDDVCDAACGDVAVAGIYDVLRRPRLFAATSRAREPVRGAVLPAGVGALQRGAAAAASLRRVRQDMGGKSGDKGRGGGRSVRWPLFVANRPAKRLASRRPPFHVANRRPSASLSSARGNGRISATTVCGAGSKRRCRVAASSRAFPSE